MKIQEIKRLIENYTLSDLIDSEQKLLNEETLLININGVDDGDKLTHVLAAIWSKNELNSNPHLSISEVIRNYTLRVRNTIN